MTARRVILAEARLVDGGWLALVWRHGARGLVPLIGGDGRERLFPDARSAEQAAMRALRERT